MNPERPRPPRLVPDPDAFDRCERLALYEIVNALLNLASDVQTTLGMRPDACQIYLVIAVSAVQRYARDPSVGDRDGPDPLPESLIGSISRRRVSDTTGVPHETVARHIRHLVDRGLVIEVGRGKLTTPPGLLRYVGPSGLPKRLLAEFAGAAQRLVTLGAVRVEVAGRNDSRS